MITRTVDERVAQVVLNVLAQKGAEGQAVLPESQLYEDGLGFDSLDTATLSAALEGEFGKDPYTAGEFPRTVGELTRFFEPHP